MGSRPYRSIRSRLACVSLHIKKPQSHHPSAPCSRSVPSKEKSVGMSSFWALGFKYLREVRVWGFPADRFVASGLLLSELDEGPWIIQKSSVSRPTRIKKTHLNI